MMKQLTTLFFVTLLPLTLTFGQSETTAKKQPTIMVMPSDNWCIERGFYNTYEDPQSGEKIKTPDYRQAFNESQQLGQVISKIGELFNDRGFPLREMDQMMKNIQEEKALDEAEAGGRGTKKTLKSQLLNTARADIILYLNWSVEEKGPYKQVSFVIDAVDPYIAEGVGSASGTGPKNTGNINKLLEEAVLKHISNLQSQMQDYFDDLNENGRKIRMRVKLTQGTGFNLKDYCSSKEEFQIGQIVEDAVLYKAVNKSYRIGMETKTNLNFDMIRMPMFETQETAFETTKVSMRATDFAENIKELIVDKCDHLNKDQITITGIGLGEVSMILGTG